MNNVVLVGKVKFKDNKEKFTSFQVSTRDGFGENKQWNNHKCICFGYTKKFVDEYINDDDVVSINGQISYNKKEEGMTYTNIIVNSVNIESYKENLKKDDSSNKKYKKPSYAGMEQEDIPF